MTTVLQRIAAQLSSRKHFSETAIERAIDAVADTFGCMIAGAGDPAVTGVTAAFASEIAGGGSAWLVAGGGAPSSIAALVNGTAAHALDFDDNFHPARAHASAVLVPALLATVAAGRPVSGGAFLSAYLAGLDAQAAVGFGVNPSHYNRGWHGTATVGAIGAAAGVAQLLGASEEETAQAMSLAASLACGPKGQFGTLAKPLHAGIAARNAVEAARLAIAGIGGRLDILERPQGFLDLFGGDDPRAWTDLRPEPAHIIERRGLVTKRHPCCASTHRAIDALLELKRDYGLTADDILSIDTKVGVSAFRNLAYAEPADEMQARFSMQYCLATAFLNGSVSLGDFTRSAVSRPDVRMLAKRITMESYSADEEKGNERLPHIVTVRLSDGTTLRRQRLHAKGSVEDPLSTQDRREKFEDCLKWGNRQPGCDLYARLRRLNEAADLWTELGMANHSRKAELLAGPETV
ncbi:2-methylcitrate dehydratase [Rhizobium sp. M10]|uniref:MmgE/PrpD family protein n=1 Tax=Rhizobium sp. M10 TaxID=1324586 RepID=UPI000BE97789|nr:MmgE/PrpD family protein [Rhizobium sp. M10]PDT39068.1 2-methylcitrate dehydratase [Rhizobium sp. M10]